MKEDTTAPKVRLRAIEPEDLDLLYKIENDTELWNAGTTNVPYSRYILHDYIANTTGDIYTDKQVRLMIETADGEAAGIIDLTNFSPAHLRAEIGIVVMKEHRNRGIALSAVREMSAYALNTLHLHQIYALTGSSNDAAIRLFTHAGFRRQGTLKDWLHTANGYEDAILMYQPLSKE